MKFTFLSLLLVVIAASTLTAQTAEQMSDYDYTNKFNNEAGDYTETVYALAHTYNPKFRNAGSITASAAGYAKMKQDLEALDAVCQRFPNLKNRDGAPPDNIGQNPADWCLMARQRDTLIPAVKGTVAGIRGGQNATRWINKVNTAMHRPDGQVSDELQMLIYDREAWKSKELGAFNKRYETGGTPPEFLPLFKKADEFKAQIERTAPTRNWTQPAYSDVGFEAAVRAAYPGQFPGVKVYKTGMTSTTWKAMDDTSVISSGTDYTLYKTIIGAYRYKLGLALVKLPNQPFCQIRDFQFTQEKAGAGYSASKLRTPLGATGIFVSCP